MTPRRPATRLDGLGVSLIRQVFEAAPADAINLGLGDPDANTPQPILAAAGQALSGRLPYTPNAGEPALRQRVAEIAAEWSGRETLDGSWVCITVGATGALHTALLAWVGPGDEVLLPDPGYPSYAAATQLAGAEPVSYPLVAAEGFRLDVEAVAERVSPATRALVVNSPSNPCGTTVPRETLESLAELAADHELLVVSDETYREIWFGEPPTSWLEVADDGLVIGSLSKSAAMTGWRVGWLVGPPERIEPVVVVNQYTVTCAPTLSQRAALAAFDPTSRERMEELRGELEGRRDLMTRLVDEQLGLPRSQPAGAYYLMVEAAPDGGGLQLAMELLEAGVITIPGEAFGKEARSWLRLSYAASEDAIREGIDRLASYLESR